MIDKKLIDNIVRNQPYPHLFITISGAHLYGFPSPDSDYDIRGAHILPLKDVLGLSASHETLEKSGVYEGKEIDLVTHDIKKFITLMLKKNGYVLEQLLSPLVIHTSPEHEELKELARGCITKHHACHYLGFVNTQWKLFVKETPPRIKPLLYVYRVLLTGIHLMRTGEIEANLLTLNESFKFSYIPELVARKNTGKEKSVLSNADLLFHQKEYERLEALLNEAHETSSLPEHPSTRNELNDLLVRLRLKQS